MIDKYTFSQVNKTRYWYCCQKVQGCKAGVKMDYDGVTVVAVDLEHSHMPPKYKINKRGEYVIVARRNEKT